MPQVSPKPTRYALRSLIQTTILISLVGLAVSACSSTRDVDEIRTVSEPEQVTPLDIPLPPPVRMTPVEWVVVTPQNIEFILDSLDESGNEQVLIALTPNDYERLSIDIAELRRYINNQRAILIRYQKYYESDETTRE